MITPKHGAIVNVIRGKDTGPLKRYIDQVKHQNKKGLLSVIRDDNQKFLRRMLQKNPIENYVEKMAKQSLYEKKGSSFLDIKA